MRRVGEAPMARGRCQDEGEKLRSSTAVFALNECRGARAEAGMDVSRRHRRRRHRPGRTVEPPSVASLIATDLGERLPERLSRWMPCFPPARGCRSPGRPIPHDGYGGRSGASGRDRAGAIAELPPRRLGASAARGRTARELERAAERAAERPHPARRPAPAHPACERIAIETPCAPRCLRFGAGREPAGKGGAKMPEGIPVRERRSRTAHNSPVRPETAHGSSDRPATATRSPSPGFARRRAARRGGIRLPPAHTRRPTGIGRRAGSCARDPLGLAAPADRVATAAVSPASPPIGTLAVAAERLHRSERPSRTVAKARRPSPIRRTVHRLADAVPNAPCGRAMPAIPHLAPEAIRRLDERSYRQRAADGAEARQPA